MHHPPMPPSPFPPYHHWYTDVEPAYEKPAECECHFPPMPDNCVCVTEEDAHNWNYAYNIVSAVSAGLDVQAIASAAQLLTSADYWNSAYNAVTASADLWNKLPELSSTFKTSADYLQWQILSAMKINVDNITITGDGHTYPLGVAYSEQIDQLVAQYEELIRNTPDAKAIYDALTEAMANCEEDINNRISELSGGHEQNYRLILELMGVVPNSGNSPMIWANDQGMHSDDETSYKGNKTLNWMYYSTYQG